jgi:hypothetical protein
MDTETYTTVTIDRKTLTALKETNENHRSANALIQDLIQLHNNSKTDLGF